MDKSQMEKDLSRAVIARDLLNSKEWGLWLEIATDEVNRALVDITSKKYVKDHAGYVERLADLQAHRNMIKKLQAYADPKFMKLRKEQLDAAELPADE